MTGMTPETQDDVRTRMSIWDPFSAPLAALKRRVNKHPRLAKGFNFVRQVEKEQGGVNAGLAAAGAAFWLLISLFPAMIAIVSIYGLIVSPDTVVTALQDTTTSLSGPVSHALTGQLQVVASHSGVLSLGLFVSLAVSLWSVSAGTGAMISAIRQTYNMYGYPLVTARKRALTGALCAVIGVGIVSLGVVAETEFLRGQHAVIIGVFTALTDIPVVLGLVCLTVYGLYRLALGKAPSVRELLPGVIFSAVALMLLVLAYSGFVAYSSSRYSEVYGTVAGFVLALMLAYFATYVVLIGACINAVLHPLADALGNELPRASDDTDTQEVSSSTIPTPRTQPTTSMDSVTP